VLTGHAACDFVFDTAALRVLHALAQVVPAPPAAPGELAFEACSLSLGNVSIASGSCFSYDLVRGPRAGDGRPRHGGLRLGRALQQCALVVPAPADAPGGPACAACSLRPGGVCTASRCRAPPGAAPRLEVARTAAPRK